MMKKRILGLFVFVMCLISQLAIAAYPENQKRFVNDFVGIMDASTKERIEMTLRNFEKATTNEIAIAIVPSLNGESVEEYAVNLFKKWGIGKKGKDNGLLLLIAMKDRKMRIEVGYGLEGVLTDLKAGRIIDNNLKPHFKKAATGDQSEYAKGIEEALSVVISTIAPPPPKVITPEERARIQEENRAKYHARLEQEKRDKEAHEQFVNIVYLFAVIIVAFGILAYLIMLLRKRVKKYFANRRRRKEFTQVVSSELQKRSDIYKTFIEKFESSRVDVDRLPEWQKNMSNDLSTVISDLMYEYIQVSTAAKVALRSGQLPELEEVNQRFMNTRDLSVNIQGNLKSLVLLSEEFDQLRQSGKDALMQLHKKITEVKKNIKEMMRKGYRIKNEEIIGDAEKLCKQLDVGLVADEDPRVIVESVKVICDRLEFLGSSLLNLENVRQSNEKNIAVFSDTFSLITSEKEKAGETLERVKSESPPEIWYDLSSQLANVDSIAKTAEMTIALAVKDNSMQEQNFSEALAGVSKARNLTDAIFRTFSDIQKTKKDIEKSKKDYPGLLANAETKLVEARRSVSDSDVKSKTKNRIHEAESQLASVKKLASTKDGLVNWLAVGAALGGVLEYLVDTIKMARRDIDAAETEKEQVAEALRKKKQREEVAEATAVAAAVASQSQHESSTPSSVSSNDFDFGGGGSGGGGASGDW